MKIVCLTVGKKHDSDLAAVIAKYQTRLNAYTNFEFEYINTSTIDTESETMISRINATDKVILLDETGTLLTNLHLAQHLDAMQNQSVKRLVIIIGGAYGVNQQLTSRSDLTISLSKLVFPHQLVRLLLVEQLYRSFNLLAGGKYHHN